MDGDPAGTAKSSVPRTVRDAGYPGRRATNATRPSRPPRLRADGGSRVGSDTEVTGGGSADHAGPCCKFGAVRDEYGLGSLERELGDKWSDPEAAGLRPLAREFNRAVLRQVLTRVGEPPLPGEVENLYRLLRGGGDVSSADRDRARRKLRKHDLEPDAVEADFISYRTVDRHFKNCTDREKRTRETGTGDVTDAAEERIDKLRNRLAAVTERTISDLDDADRIDVPTVDVTVSVDVICLDCGTQYSVRHVLEEGCPECGATPT